MAKNQAKQNNERRFKGSYILIAALLVMVGVFAVSIIHKGAEIHRKEKELEEVSQQVVDQQEENAKLQAVIDGEQGDYMEKIAREELGYGKLGEKFFYNVTPGANG